MKKGIALIIALCFVFSSLGGAVFADNFAKNYIALHSSYDDLAEQKRQDIINSEGVVVPSDTHTTFYISPDGDDSADGKSPQTPWKTTDNLWNYSWFNFGDVVLFERGGIYRDAHFVLMNGLSYGAYGQGEKPMLYGSAKNYSDPTLWSEADNNIWSIKLDDEITNIGNIVFDNGKKCGIYQRENTLNKDFQFWEDKDNHILYLYLSEGNPGDIYSDIEICDGRNILSAGPNKNIRVDNLCLRYTGAHGMSFGDGGENVTITNCEVGYIGGSQLIGYPNFVRYGNGIEFYGNSTGSIVDNCWVYQCYDAGLTNQGTNSVISNLTFKNNLIEYCQYCIEIWVGDNDLKYSGVSANDNSKLINCVYENNILRFAGYNFEYDNRLGSNTSAAACISAYDFCLPCDENTVIKNNVFDTSYRYLVSIIKPNSPLGPKIIGNTWITNDFADDESDCLGNIPTVACVGQTRNNNDRTVFYAGNQQTMEASVKVFDLAPKSIVFDVEEEETEPTSEDKTEATSEDKTEPTSVDKTEPTSEVKTQASHTLCSHSIVLKNQKVATYFKKGYSGDQVCSICSVVIKAGNTIPKKQVKTPKFKVKKRGRKIIIKCKQKIQVKYKKGKKTVIKTAKIIKLKKGRYKIALRAFYKKSGKTAYSKWTKPKTVTIK